VAFPAKIRAQIEIVPSAACGCPAAARRLRAQTPDHMGEAAGDALLAGEPLAPELGAEEAPGEL
jgi:hypothetical protein